MESQSIAADPLPCKNTLERTLTALADIAANGIPIGKNARLVAKVKNLNHGDSENRPNPAVMVGVSVSF